MPQINGGSTETLIPAMIIFSVIVSTLLGMPNEIVNSRNDGVYRNYKINGISKISTLLVPAISTAVHSFIVSCIIFFTAPMLFDIESKYSLISLLIVFFCVYITCSGIALIIGSISDNTSVTVVLAQIIFLPSMLIGGLMIPTSQLPKSLIKFSELLPTTYAMDLLEALNNINPSKYSSLLSILVLLSVGLIGYIVANYLFRFDVTDKSKKKIIALFVLLPFVINILFL
ncbi:ABC transporter permease [Ruminiclostridium herbifermentans]|uniref:ABC transporter permease n=2 Tax=Ruminiclostridium herbifermentans TaxID=2488810 RepID=A0A7H1VL08_9FIRM|nr:ABC transporter permease [Ruminiclostridium herbifermentans]